jgi:small subunit ribosomal protein S17
VARTMRKVRVGSVVRTSREKTATVEMVWKQRHRLYRKQMRRVARFQVHDPENQCKLGDLVRIEETRPISKTKHWRILEILQRRQVADVAPIELESDAVIDEPEDEAAQDAPEAFVAEEPAEDAEDSAVDEDGQEDGQEDDTEPKEDENEEDARP